MGEDISNDDIIRNFETIQLDAATPEDSDLEPGETRMHFLGADLGRYAVSDGLPTAYTVIEASYPNADEQIHIDPGYNAIRSYREAGLHPAEYNTVLQTHAHHDHFANLLGVVEMTYRAMVDKDELRGMAERHLRRPEFTDTELVANSTTIDGTPREVPAVTSYIKQTLGEDRITRLGYGDEVTTEGGTDIQAIFNQHTEVLETEDPFELRSEANSYILDLPGDFTCVYLSEGPIHDESGDIHDRILRPLENTVYEDGHTAIVGEVGPVYEPGTAREDFSSVPELWRNHMGGLGAVLLGEHYGLRTDVDILLKEWGRETTRIQDDNLSKKLEEQGYSDLREWFVDRVDAVTKAGNLHLIESGDQVVYDGDSLHHGGSA